MTVESVCGIRCSRTVLYQLFEEAILKAIIKWVESQCNGINRQQTNRTGIHFYEGIPFCIILNQSSPPAAISAISAISAT